MATLVQKLAEFTGALQLAGGGTADKLALLRSKIAAVLITQDPSLGPVPDDPSADSLLQTAAKAGEALAATWKANGVLQPRYVEEPYLAVELDPQQPTEVLGPYVTEDLILVQYSFYQAAEFVFVRTPSINVALLPKTTAKDPHNPSRWIVPAGTVWVSADRLVMGARGWAGLRVSSGSVVADGAVSMGTLLRLDPTKPWTLTLVPEQPPAGVNGSDGDYATVRLPTELVISSTAAPVAKGTLELTNFGAAAFTGPSTGVSKPANDDVVEFAFPLANKTWQITTNKSSLFTLRLDQPVRVTSARWALRVSPLTKEQLGEAKHGGSYAIQVAKGLRSQVTETVRESRWSATSITVNARGIEMSTASAASDITMNLALWGQSRTTAQVSDVRDKIIVRHASRRTGADLAGFEHGRVVNSWDRPRAASGTPFEFTGTLSSLTFIREDAAPLRRVALRAVRAPDPQAIYGYALENMYLHTKQPRSLALVGSGSAPGRLTEGSARLVFDVYMAQPMLPHPYAANWDADERDFATIESALQSDITWSAAKAPVVQSTLLSPVEMPDPPAPNNPDEPERGRLNLLDVSGRDDQLGVTLVLGGQELPTIEDNRLVWPMSAMALTMLPQVLWEPVQVAPGVLVPPPLNAIVGGP